MPGRVPRYQSFSPVALVFAITTGCKHDPPSQPETTHASVADASLTTLRPASSSSHPVAVVPSGKPPGAAHPSGPGPTAEAVLLEAKAHVEEAVTHTTAKEVCAAVLPLLDVSYSIARASTPLDESTLAVFARCAAEHQRWRLLHELAEAIAAGERKLETTYFMPRSLVGEGSYELAFSLSKATLRAWPTEAEAYNAAALAALRMKDWEAAMKAADQALLLQRKHNVNNEVTSLAHGLRGAALLRMGKTEEGLHEVDAAKLHDTTLRAADITVEAAHAAKEHGVLATVDAPLAAYPALWPMYAKRIAPLAGLVTVTVQNLTDKPMPVVVEVALDGAETAAESETVQKGHPLTIALTPELKVGSPLLSPTKTSEPHEVVVTISGGPDHGVLYRETRKVAFQPSDELPRVLRAHGDDLRSAFALEAAWVTPAAPAIVAVVEAAKARLKEPSKKFAGASGPSLPEAQALWDELRSRGVAFRRDPRIDSEVHEAIGCKLPAEILEAGAGNALESSVVLASLLEAIGLDVILVRTPGHRLVGWIGTSADLAAPGTAASTVKSPLGQAFFLETTTVGEGPFDAAILRGAAAWVAATNDGSVASGRAEVERLADLRHRGILAR